MKLELSAVVVAAGKSRRFNQSLKSDRAVSKQLLQWDGAPLFVHTLKALSILPISEWALVIMNEEEAEICDQLRNFLPHLKVKIVFGGERRQDSVRNGLNALSVCERVFVHDAARPFLSTEFLTQLNDASKLSPAVIPAIKVVETLKEVDEKGRVVRTHDRNRFVRIQTPQFFEYGLLKRVHNELASSADEFTDDAMMVERSGVAVQTIAGDAQNIKVTTVDDLRSRGIYV
jgi:2-C-methyl-D-erythritol 4-phosphate cytidylyltransferase